MEKFYTYLNNSDENQFHKYMVGFLIFIGVATGSIMFQYYRKTSALKRQIAALNVTREEVKILLDRAQHVKKEQKDVDEMLALDPNFKIADDFEKALNKLGLSNKQLKKVEVTSQAREGRYQERILDARLANMTMKELTQLLQEIEQNRRVFPKELEISASKKNQNAIDVNLKIATLEATSQEGEEGE